MMKPVRNRRITLNMTSNETMKPRKRFIAEALWITTRNERLHEL